jgi:hypothetical protein
MVAEIPEGIGPPRPGSGMGGLTEAAFVIAIEPALSVSAVFVIAIEPALGVSAVNHVVKVLNHNEFSV